MKDENWKEVVNFEGLYKVSNLGRVMSIKEQGGYRANMVRPMCRWLIMRASRGTHGYPAVRLMKNKKSHLLRVHRLVALAFIDNKQGKPCVNHKDSVRDNNNVKNLEWCTKKENTQHALKKGRLRNVHGRVAKMTEKNVKRLRLYSSHGFTDSLNAYIFNISRENASVIRRRDSWKWVD
jgi:hypothetical protein